MSTPPLPPDRPTERLQPAAPPPQYERVVDPRAPVATDATILFTRLEDAISSLRTWLAVIGLVAVAALGLGLYAVLRNDTGATGATASADRVARLNDRVDRLSRQVQELRSATSGTTALSRRVDALSRQIATLRSSQGANGSSSTDTTRALQDLNRRVDDLTRQVQQLGGTQTTP
jgi:polyhydroxyalkanoate synthesis regulator phasin